MSLHSFPGTLYACGASSCGTAVGVHVLKYRLTNPHGFQAAPLLTLTN